MVVSTCTGGNDQLWTFKNGAVAAFNGTKCLDVTNGNNSNGAKLQIWDCAPSNANQQWYWTTDNHLAWTNHGRCLDLTGGSLTDGNKVQIWDCAGYVGTFNVCLIITDSRNTGATTIKVGFRSSLLCCGRLTLGALQSGTSMIVECTRCGLLFLRRLPLCPLICMTSLFVGLFSNRCSSFGQGIPHGSFPSH